MSFPPSIEELRIYIHDLPHLNAPLNPPTYSHTLTRSPLKRSLPPPRQRGSTTQFREEPDFHLFLAYLGCGVGRFLGPRRGHTPSAP